ncbi:MAG: nucleotidyltransferase domain-containing protein [Nanoarchaeota archaeon]|nr:nucleotidyltransferase domain-containing protein [Nanoarchaeota archaeon]
MVQNKNNLDLEIILALLKNKAHLREIARILNESHSTILRKINELVKENVLDYNKEGKNKVFLIKNNLKAKNYVYSAEIHKLNILLRKHPELSIIFEDIKKNFSKGMIILFGSYAKGIPKKDSDIDIYLETIDNSLKIKIKAINSKLSIKIGKFDTKSLLIKEIIRNHIIIRGLENFYERVEFFKEA